MVPFDRGASILLAVRYFLGTSADGWGFIMTSLAIVFATVTLFVGLFPRLMVSPSTPSGA